MSSRRPHGFFLMDGKEVADTHQCPHCNAHFEIMKGSGRKRGFCMNCMAALCDNPECHTCVPFEKKLDELSAGKRLSLDRADPRQPG